jgi:hypothetical protein
MLGTRVLIRAGSEFWVAQVRPNFDCPPTIKYLKKIKCQILIFFFLKCKILDILCF